ncbi:prepilin-type N-terminal cleavage/methylation domain-containing protein [Clostridium beijerinckii]|uniref:prepilin-type N-terminal cleavage/methylation domain-containing protein n=1 Tax=Clostridium beijerinckii TaxID=1520 RepID=UPI001494548D|nr:prepilin-type N-terminal cleavage/methylation domain-containing protein [Clostridium beijerinckii]NOW05927.1 type IV pilus assembly protein PilA [Clostridium beijerinckii]NYC00929.1 type IV pilus assembly protein PilA [Clostridium beijerinckii]
MNQLSLGKSNELLKKKSKGFTLVELIIVIAIIAILAAIAIPKFGTVRTNANTKTDIATAKTIATAVASGIANGDIKLPTAATDYALTAVGETGGVLDVTTKVDGTTVPKAHPTETFKVNLKPDGTITVSYSTTTGPLFPQQ